MAYCPTPLQECQTRDPEKPWSTTKSSRAVLMIINLLSNATLAPNICSYLSATLSQLILDINGALLQLSKRSEQGSATKFVHKTYHI